MLILITSVKSLQRTISLVRGNKAVNMIVGDILHQKKVLIVSHKQDKSTRIGRAIRDELLSLTGGALKARIDTTGCAYFINGGTILMRSFNKGTASIRGIDNANVYIFDGDKLRTEDRRTIVLCAHPYGDITIVEKGDDSTETDNGSVRVGDTSTTDEREGLRVEEG